MTPRRQEDVWDPEHEERHKAEIQRQLYRLAIWLIGNAKTVRLDQDLVRWFHRQVFEAPFPHVAGVVRGNLAPYPIKFGPFYGAPPEECEQRFAALCDQGLSNIAALDEMDEGERREHAFQVACFHHVQFIEIHPFVDGNGRIGRTCVNYFAARYRLRPVVMDRTTKSDYEVAIGMWIREKRLDPLIQFWRPIMFPPSAA